jgi:cell division protein FtsL
MEQNDIKKDENRSRRISPLTVIFAFVIISVGISFHINNVLTVNKLVVENDTLRKKLTKMKEQNENLVNEIEKLSSIQRIMPLAKELGLEYNNEKINYYEVQK